MELVATEYMTLQKYFIFLIVREHILLIVEVLRHVVLMLDFTCPTAQGLDDGLAEPQPIEADRTSQVLYLFILLQQLLVVLLGHFYPIMLVVARRLCVFLRVEVGCLRGNQFLLEALVIHLNKFLLCYAAGSAPP